MVSLVVRVGRNFEFRFAAMGVTISSKKVSPHVVNFRQIWPGRPKRPLTLSNIWPAEARSMPLTSAKSGSEKPSERPFNAANSINSRPGEAAERR
jgi:hypothetical protein